MCSSGSTHEMLPAAPFIFDWDGTLSDSVGRIVTCLRRAALDLGLEDLGDEAFSDVIGLGLPQAIAQLYPGLDADAGERFRVGYAAHFIAEDVAPSSLFPKALEVLEELRARGHYIAVATGKSRRGLDRVLASMGMEGFFHATRCADETASKPDPRMVLEIIEELGAGGRAGGRGGRYRIRYGNGAPGRCAWNWRELWRAFAGAPGSLSPVVDSGLSQRIAGTGFPGSSG